MRVPVRTFGAQFDPVSAKVIMRRRVYNYLELRWDDLHTGAGEQRMERQI